jgi:hypothetical protein
MPAIQVARTDTFEIQRQKINQIGDQIFNISAGGSDLSTGNLRLGDGSVPNPSLAFTNDNSLGLYRPSSGVIGFVYDSKKIFDVEPQNFVFYKDFTVRQQVLYNGGLSILNSGENYDPGNYLSVPLIGGTGNNATADVVVEQFIGSITQTGAGYKNGSFSGIELQGGSGSGATITFTIDGIEGDIIGGSGYVPGTYSNVSLTNISGSGSGAIANIAIQGEVGFGGTITGGSGYTDGSYDQVPVYNVAAQTFVVTITTNPNAGQPGEPDNLYVIDGVTQETVTLTVGNTYKFDTSDPSLSTHPFRFETQFLGPLNQGDSPGVTGSAVGNIGSPGSYYYVVIKDTTSPSLVLGYDCEVHNGMGGSVSLQSGSSGNFGTGASATATVTGGEVTSYLISGGDDYFTGNIVYSESSNMGGPGGSGFQFELTGNVYTGTVSSVIFVDIGNGYVNGDILSANTADLGGQGDGAFTLTITSNPGILDSFSFDDKGSGYAASDVLTLPSGQTGISVILPGQVLNVITTLSSSSPQITVADTTGIVAGMQVFNGQSDTGVLSPNTTVQSVDSSTTLTLSATPTVSGSAELNFQTPSLTDITLTSVSGFTTGDIVIQTGGSGVLAPGTTIASIDEGTKTIVLSTPPTTAGNAIISILPPYGVGSQQLEYTVNKIGGIESISIVNGGNGYLAGDILSIANTNLVQEIVYTVSRSQVIEITFSGTVPASAFSIGDTITESGVTQGASSEVIEVRTSGGNITSIISSSSGLVDGTLVENGSNPGPTYTINTVTDLGTKIFIDTGSGPVITPDITLFVGDTYNFDLSDSSNDGTEFALSQYPGGSWGSSYFTFSGVTFDVSSNLISVPDTTGIVAGMTIETDGQSGATLIEGTTVTEVVDSTTLRISSTPSTSGSADIIIRGVEYTQGVTTGTGSLIIKVIDTTPNLYYYDKLSENQGGEVGAEALITIDSNNPKVFGSGLQISVLDTEQDDVITADIETGDFFAKTGTFETTLDAAEANFSTSISSPFGSIDSIAASSISSSTNLTISAITTNLNSNLNIGSALSIVRSNGNITTSGSIKTTSFVNVNDRLLIEDNKIISNVGYDLNLTSAAGKLVKVTGTQALVIPSGNSGDRPLYPTAQNGAIRYNTETNQYEGFSVLSGQSSGTWSSLGGVRDIDGNTYILAELTPNANDNNLWFYNDGVNSVRFNRNYLEFVRMKRIRSLNTNTPEYTEWTAQTSVVVGQYLKYKHSIYEVVGDGATATSGNEPNDTTGNPFTNGTATLQYFTTAVSNLIFEEISEIQVGPTKSTPMVFEGDLRITKNTIATDLTDLNLKPNTGKRIVCVAKTHLQIPAGTDSEKSTGTAKNGSIRYNTTNQVYEGFNENTQTWGSLGGVKDVDQNTYIIPELGPGTNENILYFFNDNVNTIQLTTTTLDFTNINTVSCSFDDSLEITASTITFDNSSTTIDNTVSDRTFIHTSKDKLDLGLSTGLVVDPLLRLDDQGDVYYNVGFGTGSESLVRIFDKELANLEISKYRITTSNAALLKGTTNNGSAVIYAPSTELSAKVELVAHNTTTGAKEVIEFSVIDNGSDIFYTEVGTIQSNASIINYTFDFNVNNAVRLNYSLATGVANANAVNVTVVSNVIKK